MFFNFIGVSITISIAIFILMLLSYRLNERYSVKWRYFLWLFLAVRLVIPLDFGLTAPPLELKFADHEIVWSFNGNHMPELSVSGNSVSAANAEDASRRTAAGAGKSDIQNGSGYATAANSNGTGQSDFQNRTAGIDKTTAANGTIGSGQSAAGAIAVSKAAGWVYLAGITVFLLYQMGLYLSFRHSARRWYREISNPRILESFDNLKTEMGILRTFRIRICRKILSPMITGLFRPTLLLPHEEYETADLELILKHELIHFRRNDLWFKLLLICANALHWFNPFIYAMVKEANRDIEISCDEEVLKGADLQVRKRYSERILELMQGNNIQEVPISTNFHGGKGMMKRRIFHIFDERAKRKGVLSFLIILAAVLAFSACSFAIEQNQWRIDPAVNSVSKPQGDDAKGNAAGQPANIKTSLAFDFDQDGTKEAEFLLLVEGETAYLQYKNDSGRTIQREVLKGVESGFDYSLQAANLESMNSIMFLVSVDYRGMPFGAGYWEIYSWDGKDFKPVEMKKIEENLQMRILEADEIQNNVMNAGVAAYLYETKDYPADYPALGIYFKDGYQTDGKSLGSIDYAPMTEYDVEGYRTWGQGAVNKSMVKMNFVVGDKADGWTDPTRALLETEEVVFITLPNVSALVTSYYEYRNGKWVIFDRYISPDWETP